MPPRFLVHLVFPNDLQHRSCYEGAHEPVDLSELRLWYEVSDGMVWWGIYLFRVHHTHVKSLEHTHTHSHMRKSEGCRNKHTDIQTGTCTQTHSDTDMHRDSCMSTHIQLHRYRHVHTYRCTRTRPSLPHLQIRMCTLKHADRSTCTHTNLHMVASFSHKP